MYPTTTAYPGDSDDDPLKFVLSSRIIGEGSGVILDREGNRICDEKSSSQLVCKEMQKAMQAGQGPLRLVFSSVPADLSWTVGFCVKQQVLSEYAGPKELSMAIGVPESAIVEAIKQDAGTFY